MLYAKMKLRQRIAVVTCLTMFCALALIMIQTEMSIVSRLPEDANSIDSNLHPVWQRRFLNREETSKISGENGNTVLKNVLLAKQVISNVKSKNASSNGGTTSTSTSKPRTTQKPRDNFTDLFKFTIWSDGFRKFLSPPKYVLPKDNPTLQEWLQIDARIKAFGSYQAALRSIAMNVKIPSIKTNQTRKQFIAVPPGKGRENLTNWEKFHLQISRFELYPEHSDVVDGMLRDIATQKMVAVEQLPGGTQLKFVVTFENGGQALYKPQRYSREVETLPNHFYFTDFERHNSEIAAYHLDRILGFRRAPPVVGRVVNLTSELYPLADEALLKTFFVSPAGNICFHGRCKYYCDTAHAFCGNPDTLEGSFASFLPPESVLRRHPVSSPWRRSYNKRKKAIWETDENYCNQVKLLPEYKTGRRLYDIMDMHAFDFLIGNMDRHHLEEVLLFGNDSALIHWDHGRGFGRPYHDEFSILAPIIQCCLFRLSTFNRLYELHNGPQRLSELMAKSMARDPIAPILTYPHLHALDRRVGIILETLRNCLKYKHPSEVFLDDLPSDIDELRQSEEYIS